jgi:hypothetical protein
MIYHRQASGQPGKSWPAPQRKTPWRNAMGFFFGKKFSHKKSGQVLPPDRFQENQIRGWIKCDWQPTSCS